MHQSGVPIDATRLDQTWNGIVPRFTRKRSDASSSQTNASISRSASPLHIRSVRSHPGVNGGASFWKNDFPAMPSG